MPAYLLLVALMMSTPACESCEFTYGTLEITGMLAIKGPAPSDLSFQVCDGPAQNDCGGPEQDGYLVNGLLGPEPQSYQAWVPPEGVFSCGFPRRWLVVTGTDCTTTAVEAVPSENLDDVPIGMPITIDLELHCALSP